MMKSMKVISMPSLGRGAILVVTAAWLGACNADHTLGDVTGAAGNGSDGGVVWNPLIDAGSGPDVGPLGPTQSWTGYVEHQTFPSGSEVIKLTFATDSAGTVVGTIVVGQGTPPPPATDPNVGYPPSLETKITTIPSLIIAEGYPYAFTGTLEGNRLRFHASFTQLWKDWCALQTSYPPGSCAPRTMASMDYVNNKCEYQGPNANQVTPVDCGKALLCGLSSPCECGAQGCHAYPENRGLADVDMLISDGSANGSSVGVVSGNVHFTKDP